LRPRTFRCTHFSIAGERAAGLREQDLGEAGSLEVVYELEALMLTGQCIDIAARTRQAVRLLPCRRLNRVHASLSACRSFCCAAQSFLIKEHLFPSSRSHRSRSST